MGFSSPRRSWLYRNALVAVTLLGLTCGAWTWIFAQGIVTPYGRRAPVSKGPRALGLIMLSPKGKARLTPIAIMVDGKFYDAGAYKATPVPMALDFGVVYEGFRSGVSQGLFTVTQPGQLNHNWMAEGTWLPAGAKPPETGKKYETPVIEDNDAPPRLHRGSDKPAPDASDQQKPAPPAAPAPSAPAPPPAASAAKAPPEPESIDDPNRPVLRRGKPNLNARREDLKTFEEDEFTPKKKGAPPAAGAAVRIIPAISDAGGPDARPYTYEVKPQEEASYRAKMLDLAAAELRARAKSEIPLNVAGKRRARKAAKPPQPSFDDVQLRIFDLSNSNEPVLVLSAKTQVAGGGDNREPQEITLVARTDLEGELRKLFFSETDSQHLDVEPRMALIDAVDADGDGRGELLFRETSDAGSTYDIYRVTADQLWPLYEGTP
jgi:hypothetical protein